MAFVYKAVNVPRSLTIMASALKDKTTGTKVVSEYLETAINSYAQEGWEYVRSEQMALSVEPGCVGIFLGQRESTSIYSVMIFRKEATGNDHAERLAMTKEFEKESFEDLVRKAKG